MHFLNRQEGWAVSEPSGIGGPRGSVEQAGWWALSPLATAVVPGNSPRPAAPTRRQALVSRASSEPKESWSAGANRQLGLHDVVRVYTTHDGGDTWFGRAPPSDPASDRYGNAPQLWAADFPFSASSPTDWMLFIGPKLYVTHDAGEHWETLTPAPAIGQVFSLDDDVGIVGLGLGHRSPL